jgi:hypothetical protein
MSKGHRKPTSRPAPRPARPRARPVDAHTVTRQVIAPLEVRQLVAWGVSLFDIAQATNGAPQRSRWCFVCARSIPVLLWVNGRISGGEHLVLRESIPVLSEPLQENVITFTQTVAVTLCRLANGDNPA